MSNIIAGVARGQFEHLDEHVLGKKGIFDRYAAGFDGLPVKMHGGGNYWLSCMLVEGIEPGTIIDRLAEYNIEARHIWKPMSMQPVYDGCEFIGIDDNAPCGGVGREIFEKGLCLPSDLNMTEEDQADVIAIVRNCF